MRGARLGCLALILGVAGCGEAELDCRRSALTPIDHSPRETFPESPSSATEVLAIGDGLEGWRLGIFDEDCERLLGSGVVGPDGYSIVIEPPANETTVLSSATWDEACEQWSSCQYGTTFVQDSLPPTLSGVGTVPPSPANANFPIIEGITEPFAHVDLFEGLACEGRPVALDRAHRNGRFDFGVWVEDNSTSTWVVRITDAAGNALECSDPIVYEEQTP